MHRNGVQVGGDQGPGGGDEAELLKGHRALFWGDGGVLVLDGGGALCPSAIILRIVCLKIAAFLLCEFHLNKKVNQNRLKKTCVLISPPPKTYCGHTGHTSAK